MPSALPPDEPSAAVPTAVDRDRFIGDEAGAAAIAIRPAATVMLVRDGAPDPADGSTLEVCMLRRNLQSRFVGGVHVFPGGAVDPGDADEAVLARCDGIVPAQAEAAGGPAFWVAAIRESFEEAGLLPAHHEATGAPLLLDGDDDALAARFAEHRRAVDAGTRSLGAVLEAEGLRLDLSGTHYVSRWVTPLGLIRRYDTRFFVAGAPRGQTPAHDGIEAIEAEWHRPAEALRRHAAGELTMRIPTSASLGWLADWPSAEAALAAAAAIVDVPVIEGTPDTPIAPGGAVDEAGDPAPAGDRVHPEADA